MDGWPRSMYQLFDRINDEDLELHPLFGRVQEEEKLMKRVKKRLAKKDYNEAKLMLANAPRHTLDDLVLERYKSFADAIRDMGDAISLLALCGAPETWLDFDEDVMKEAKKLYQEFQFFVVRTRALRKVYASAKGYYFQGHVMGHAVTWLAPQLVTRGVLKGVNFKFMETMVDFQRSFMKFVNFRLYHGQGWAYPDRHDLVSIQKEACATNIGADDKQKTVFSNMKVFIGDQVDFEPTYFTLLCGGAKGVGWEGSKSPFGVRDEDITHQIVHKPLQHITSFDREYVQAQWVQDSFNSGCQLPIARYLPGKEPPPQLSPFEENTPAITAGSSDLQMV
eukprot:gnl/MRDRNA2_/MRDRNA2_78713_c0_seq1.p1 gnl/MRDRNA2_/MRDRNA2_78713_c0~~gnl/MRDRNA2_/MRDRNA2_78713_c0_seq1.p1  ORF type:complete len:336 (+),score=52.20 gnl/MRDRNA2_/MRDRNA2_78713_c0_seq1:4-1011(+)